MDNRITAPITIPGKMTGYDAALGEVIRHPAATVHIDLNKANAGFARVANNQGKDRISPAYNLLVSSVVDEDRDALVERLEDDHAAVLATFGAVAELLLPEVEKTEKKSLKPLKTSKAAV